MKYLDRWPERQKGIVNGCNLVLEFSPQPPNALADVLDEQIYVVDCTNHYHAYAPGKEGEHRNTEP